MQKLIGYIGTYESPASPGIDCFSLDLETGRLSAPQRRFAVPDSKYLSLLTAFWPRPSAGTGGPESACSISIHPVIPPWVNACRNNPRPAS